MKQYLNEKEELNLKIENMRQLLYDKLNQGSTADNRLEIQQLSESLDVLIVEYLKK